MRRHSSLASVGWSEMPEFGAPVGRGGGEGGGGEDETVGHPQRASIRTRLGASRAYRRCLGLKVSPHTAMVLPAMPTVEGLVEFFRNSLFFCRALTLFHRLNYVSGMADFFGSIFARALTSLGKQEPP